MTTNRFLPPASPPRRLLAGALLLAACGLPALGQAQAPAPKAVSVTAIVEHPALDSIRDGVRDELKAHGYEAGRNLKWDYQSAQGNAGTAAQIARKFVGDRPDVIVAITTPSAQATVAATRTAPIPVVYSGVTDPAAAQLAKNGEATGTNVTGLSNLLRPATQVGLIRQLLPDARRVGMVYSPGEANSVVVVRQMKEELAKHGMALVEAAAPRSVDVAGAAQSLVGKVDAIYTSTDNNVVSAYEALVKVGNDAKIPLIAADADSVRRGATAALGLNYYDFGRQTGAIVLRILRGEKPGAIRTETSDRLELVVNQAAAKRQGVAVPPALLKAARTVYQ
jgi:putative ABC transport system substrate-binding protein